MRGRRRLPASRPAGLVALMLVLVMAASCDRTPILLEGTVTTRTAVATGAPDPGGDQIRSFAPGTEVVLYQNDAVTPVARATANVVGHYVFRSSMIAEGTYRLRVGDTWWGGESWATATPIDIAASGVSVADAVLDPSGTVSGRIIESSRAGVAGAPVWATDASGAIVALSSTGGDGEFALGLRDPGAYEVHFHAGHGSIDVGGSSEKVFDIHGGAIQAGLIDAATGAQVALAGITALTAGDFHTCALHGTGTVSCWGMGSDGQLGNGTSGTNAALPVAVDGVDDAVEVDAGRMHTCALHVDGTVSCWGHDVYGELGDQSTALISTTPVQVVGITDAVAVAAGGFHTCVLHADGTVSCWGLDDAGQLGNGTTTDSSVPVAVAGLDGVIAIDAQGAHTCALQEGGTVSCWGENTYGQLGDGTTTDSAFPVTVTGITDAIEIGVGVDHTCALRSGGGVACWGWNSRGQLGDGTTTDSALPVDVTGLDDAHQLATFGHHTCALRSGGSVSCWGFNDDGELGNGTVGDATTPVRVTGVGDASSLTTGLTQSCVVHCDQTVSCWGSNTFGQLGSGTFDSTAVPVTVLAGD